MLRVTVQILPHGDEETARTLATLDVINTVDHPKRPHYGRYRVRLDGQEVGRIASHKRSRGWYWLVRRALWMVGPLPEGRVLAKANNRST